MPPISASHAHKCSFTVPTADETASGCRRRDRYSLRTAPVRLRTRGNRRPINYAGRRIVLTRRQFIAPDLEVLRQSAFVWSTTGPSSPAFDPAISYTARAGPADDADYCCRRRRRRRRKRERNGLTAALDRSPKKAAVVDRRRQKN